MPPPHPAERVLDALGNQTRREILALLRDTPMTVGTLAKQLPISRPAVSKHLGILHKAGLVRYHAHGTRNIFTIRAAGFRDVQLYLDMFWDQALENFQRVAENINQAEADDATD